MGRRPNKPKTDKVFQVPLEHADFMRRRTRFLLEPRNDGPNRSLAELLANAYHQGVDDTMEALQRTGRLAWPQSAPAQQDGWA